MPVDAAATHHATQGAADGVVAYAARRSTCRLIDVRQTDLDRRMVLGVDDAIRRRTREQSGTLLTGRHVLGDVPLARDVEIDTLALIVLHVCCGSCSREERSERQSDDDGSTRSGDRFPEQTSGMVSQVQTRARVHLPE